MKITHEMMLGKVPNNSHIRTFGWKVLNQNDKSGHTKKLDDNAEEVIHVSSREEVSRILIPGTITVRTSKNATFGECTYPYNDSITKVVSVEKLYFEDSRDDSDNITGQVRKECVPLKKPMDNQENNDLTSDARQSVTTEQKHLDEGVPGKPTPLGDKKAQDVHRYPQRERREPKWFTINGATRTRDDDEPELKDIFNGENAQEWRKAM